MAVDLVQYALSCFPDKTPNSAGRIHALCPFHDDKQASFSLDVHKGLFICGASSCGVKGNLALFYKMMEHIDSWGEVYENLKVVEVANSIEKLLGLDVEPTKHGPNTAVNMFPSDLLLEPVPLGLPFVVDRGLSLQVLNDLGVKYGTRGVHDKILLLNSLVVPLWDIDGTYRTYQVRHLSDGSRLRWNNPVGSPLQDLLYAGWHVVPNEPLWIVEGASDVWRLRSLGVQAVGLFTKAATSAQLNRLVSVCKAKECRPLIMLDGDVPESSITKIYMELSAYGLTPLRIDLNSDEDPGGLSTERFAEIREVYDV